MKSEESDSDKDQSQVIEYYYRYSQSNELPKYFCGTSQQLQQREGMDPTTAGPASTSNVPRPPLVGQDKTQRPQCVDIDDAIYENIRMLSPASSVASNKKLEWDNGADIGYKNADKIIQKSVSLPILHTQERKEISQPLLRLSPEGNTERSTPIIVQKSTDSSSTSSKQVQLSENSATSSLKSNRSRMNTASTSSSEPKAKFFQLLQKKVGLPAAQSTPADDFNLQYYETTPKPRETLPKKQKVLVPSSFECNIDPTSEGERAPVNLKSIELRLSKLNNSCDQISNVRIEQRIEKKWNSNMEFPPGKNAKTLTISKPVVVECLPSSPTLGVDEVIQTTLVKQSTASIQTDYIDHDQSNVELPQDNGGNPHEDNKDAQQVLYLYYPPDERSKYTSSSTQTASSAEVSKCNSFEYLLAKDYTDNLRDQPANVDVPLPSDHERKSLMNRFLENNLSRNLPSPNSDGANSALTSSHDSIDPNLLSRLSATQSKSVAIDLERGVELLNKLVKSKKYDRSTKRYYVKKIVQKMIESSYSDDSTPNENNKNYPTSESSEPTSATKTKKDADLLLQENKPWKPFKGDDVTTARTLQPLPQLQSHVFNQEFVPDACPNTPEKSLYVIDEGRECRERPKRSKFTLPSNPITPDVVTSPEAANLSDEYRRIFLRKDDGADHYNIVDTALLSGAKEANNNVEDKRLVTSKREHQLHWINKEIWHLSKLKRILEVEEGNAGKMDKGKSSTQCEVLRSVLNEPHVADMQRARTSTAIYMITTHKDGQNACCRPRMNIDAVNVYAKNPTTCACGRKIVQSKPSPVCTCTQTSAEDTASTSKRPSQSQSAQPRTGCCCQQKATQGTCSCPRKSCLKSDTRPAVANNVERCRRCQCRIRRCNCPPRWQVYEWEKGEFRSDGSAAATEQSSIPSIESLPEIPADKRHFDLHIPKCNCADVAQPAIAECEQYVDIDICPCKCNAATDYEPPNDSANDQPDPPPMKPTESSSCTGPASTESESIVVAPPQQEAESICPPPQEESICAPPQEESICPPPPPPADEQAPPPKCCPCKHVPSETSSTCHCHLLNDSNKKPVVCDDHESTSTDTCCCYCRKQQSQTSASTINIQASKKGCTIKFEMNGKEACKCTREMRVKESPLCNCCKSKRVLKTPCVCSVPKEDSTRFCSTCYPNWVCIPAQCRPYFPAYVCNCYRAYAQSRCLDEMRKTIRQLEQLDREECTCVRESATASDCCSYCRKRIKAKRAKNQKKSYGYLLTLKPGTPNNDEPQERPVRALDEVVVKVPDLNYYKRKSSGEKHRRSKCDSPKRRQSKDDEAQEKDCGGTFHKCSDGCKKCHPATVQDYLCVNRPNFIECAEDRRKRLVELAMMREKRCEKYKQLLAMSSGQADNNDHSTAPKQFIFTSKEMKGITARHYKKLPEVQQKLVNKRDMNVKKGNRILADMFNRKIRDLALKGKLDLSISTSVIKF